MVAMGVPRLDASRRGLLSGSTPVRKPEADAARASVNASWRRQEWQRGEDERRQLVV